MRLKRKLDDEGMMPLPQLVVVSILVIFIVVFASMWVAVGGNPLGTHEFVDVEVTAGAVDYFGIDSAEIIDADHQVSQRKGYETFEMQDFAWWDPVSADLTIRITLSVNGKRVDTDSATEDVTFTSGYTETFRLTAGPLPEDAKTYTVEVQAIVNGDVKDTTTLEGNI